MKPKHILTLLCLAFCTAIITPAVASNPVDPIKTESAEAMARQQEVLSRISEIKSLDRSTLTKTEKKELRHELRDLKKEAARSSNGIYFSVGALIVIALLLILLL